MAEVKSRFAPPEVIVGNTANLFAGLAVAPQFFWQVLGVNWSPVRASAGIRWLDLMPAMVVLIAVGLALVPGLRRFGWLVSAVGLVGLIGLYAQDGLFSADLLYLTLAVVLGVQLGGLLLAFAGTGAQGRWLIATGVGIGLAGGGSLLGLLGGLVTGSDALARYPDESVVGVSALVTVAAGVWLALRPGPSSAPGPVRARAVLVAVGVAIVVSRVLVVGWRLVLDRIGQASTGGFSQARAETVENLNRAVLLVIGAVVAAVLLVAAYRRGGAHLARMVVAVFAVSVVALDTGWPAVEVVSEDRGLLVEVALLGGVLAVALVSFLDRLVPWDVVGVLVMGVGLLGSSPPSGWSAVAVVFGVAWTLTAGLARLGGTAFGWTAGGWPAGGLSRGEVGLSAVLGFATIILCGQVFGDSGRGSPRPDGPPLDQTLTLAAVAAAAVLLILLFVRQRRVPGPAPAVPTPAAQVAEVPAG